MKKLCKLSCGVVALLSTQAFAAGTIAYVDFSDRDYLDNPGSNPNLDVGTHGGVYWTTIGATGGTEFLTDSVTDDALSWTVGVSNVEGSSPNSFMPAGHIFATSQAAYDGLWNRPDGAGGPDQRMTITISGLDGSGATTYNLSLFGNRSNNDDAGSIYTAQGAGAAIGSGTRLQGNTTGVTSPWDVSGITPTAGGVITIDVATPGGDGSTDLSIISAMSIESVPEPSTTALLGLGSISLILRRRK